MFMDLPKHFTFKLFIELVRFSAILEYDIYTPFASKLHFVL